MPLINLVLVLSQYELNKDQKLKIHSVPVNRTVRLTETSLLNSFTGLPVVRILNFVHSVPVNWTVQIMGNPICLVNEESGYCTECTVQSQLFMSIRS